MWKKKRVLWLCLLTTTTASATNVGKAYQTSVQEGKGSTGFKRNYNQQKATQISMLATNALWGEKPASARAKMIIPVFSSTPSIQNFLGNVKNWRPSNAKSLYWTSLFSHSRK